MLCFPKRGVWCAICNYILIKEWQYMTREEIHSRILKIFLEEFEIENPGPDDDLREVHEFDSIDAIELLGEIENLLNSSLTQDEKKQAMSIRTINQICDYVESVAMTRLNPA